MRKTKKAVARHGRRRRFPLFGVYTAAIVTFSLYAVLDTFAISRAYASVSERAGTVAAQAEGGSATGASAARGEAASDAGEVRTEISTVRYLDTDIYVADVYTDDATALLTALADDTYGHNVSEATSAIAEEHGALLAINGDCYGNRNAGYVVRNGVLWRSDKASEDQEDLVIYADGRFEVVREGDVTAEELVADGAWQVWSFGPGLVVDGDVSVSAGEEVGRAMASNPRTAIGKVADGHYVFVVSDGRTDESQGLSLAELAAFMRDELGVECAYNLDGGGSTTLWYGGEVLNRPTTNGRSIRERGVTDIVYVAG